MSQKVTLAAKISRRKKR